MIYKETIEKMPLNRRGWYRVSFFLLTGFVFLIGNLITSVPIYAADEVRFNEIRANSTNDDDEFIELIGPAGTDLTNWVIKHYNGGDGGQLFAHTIGEFTIPNDGVTDSTGIALGFYVLGTAVVPNVDSPDIGGGPQDGPDGIVLYDDSGKIRDAVAWEGDDNALTFDPNLTTDAPATQNNYLHVTSDCSADDTCLNAPNDVHGDDGTGWVTGTATPGEKNGNQTSGLIEIGISNIPPAPISNLTALPGSGGREVQLKWTAPEDEGLDGYVVKYSTSEILTGADWTSAIEYPQTWSAGTAGSEKSETVYGLILGTTYWFAVKGFNSVGAGSWPGESLTWYSWGDISDWNAAMPSTAPVTGFVNATSFEQAQASDPIGYILSSTGSSVGYFERKEENARDGSWSFKAGNLGMQDGSFARLTSGSIDVSTTADVVVHAYFKCADTTYEWNDCARCYVEEDGIKRDYFNLIGSDLESSDVHSYKEFKHSVTPGVSSIRIIYEVGNLVSGGQAAFETAEEKCWLDDISIIMVPPDTTPPAAISNLTALTGDSAGEVNIKWTAPGDDGAGGGDCSGYVIRYSTGKIITDSDWSNADTYSQTWAVGTAGFESSATVKNLSPGTTYWFAMKAKDNVDNYGNWPGSLAQYSSGISSADWNASYPIPLFFSGDWTDNFDDGNFTSSPTWSGDTEKWITSTTTTAGELQLFANGTEDWESLYTPSDIVDGTWSFYYKYKQDPSDANQMRVYLMSDSPDIEGNLNGYFITIGQTGSDFLKIYKKAADTETLLKDTGYGDGLSKVGLTIKVTRNGSEWEMFAKEGKSPASEVTTSIGSWTDDTYNSSVYFGVSVKHSTTYGEDWVFDNFSAAAFTGIPTITTKESSGITNTSGVLNCSFTVGFATPSVSVSFMWRKEGGEWSETTASDYASNGSHSEELTDLITGANYNFYGKLSYSTATIIPLTAITGKISTFTVCWVPPTSPDTGNLLLNEYFDSFTGDEPDEWVWNGGSGDYGQTTEEGTILIGDASFICQLYSTDYTLEQTGKTLVAARKYYAKIMAKGTGQIKFGITGAGESDFTALSDADWTAVIYSGRPSAGTSNGGLTITVKGQAGGIDWLVIGAAWLADTEPPDDWLVADNAPPAAITFLKATALAFLDGNDEGSVELQWSAPGDDGITGDNSSGYYEIRYSTREPRSGWWDAITNATTNYYGIAMSNQGILRFGDPLGQGELETKNIQRLLLNTTFYIGVKTYDNFLNPSLIETYAQVFVPDTKPPKPVSSSPEWLRASSTTATIYWEEGPFDLVSYTIQRSTELPILDFDIEWSTSASVRQFTDVSLSSGDYRYRIRTVDCSGKASAGWLSITVYDDYEPAILKVHGSSDTATFPSKICMLGNEMKFQIEVSDNNVVKTTPTVCYFNSLSISTAAIGSPPGNTALFVGTVTIPADFIYSSYIGGGFSYYITYGDRGRFWKTPDISVSVSRGQTFPWTSGETVKVDDGNDMDGETSIFLGGVTRGTSSVSSLMIYQWDVDESDVTGGTAKERVDQNINSAKPVICYSFYPLDSSGWLTDVKFTSPVEITLLYLERDGTVILDDGTTDSGATEGRLKAYFFDERQLCWRYVGGTQDTTLNTVTFNFPHLSSFAVFATEAGKIKPVQRFLSFRTPISFFDATQVTIYDVRGRRVVRLTTGDTVSNPIWWYGCDSARKPSSPSSMIESGAYIYESKGGGKKETGVIVVVK